MKSFVVRVVAAWALVASIPGAPTVASRAFAADSTAVTAPAAEKPTTAPLWVQVGDRVRITRNRAARLKPVIGSFDSISAGAVEVTPATPNPNGEPHLLVPIYEIERIETSRGKKHHTLAGAIVGLLVGGAVALAVNSSSDEGVPFAFLLLPPVGVLAGAFVGSGIESERWEIVWEPGASP